MRLGSRAPFALSPSVCRTDLGAFRLVSSSRKVPRELCSRGQAVPAPDGGIPALSGTCSGESARCSGELANQRAVGPLKKKLNFAVDAVLRFGILIKPSNEAHIFGSVAQLVEQRTENPRVRGSIPFRATMYGTAPSNGGFSFLKSVLPNRRGSNPVRARSRDKRVSVCPAKLARPQSVRYKGECPIFAWRTTWSGLDAGRCIQGPSTVKGDEPPWSSICFGRVYRLHPFS